MRGTLRRSIGRLLNSQDGSWSKSIGDVLFVYWSKPIAICVSSFELLFSDSPSLGDIPQIVDG